MKHNYLEPRADIRFQMSEDIIATSVPEVPLTPETEPADDVINDPF